MFQIRHEERKLHFTRSDMNANLTQVEMKRAMVAALEANDLEAVRPIALQSRKALSVLIRLAYDKTTLTGWRAIKAIGFVSSLYMNNNYDFLRDTIRKLLWSLSDESGGIGWSAPEILGEIVSADPHKLSDIIPLIAEVYDIEEKIFRPGVLYALLKIADASPECVLPFQEIIIKGLSDQDPLSKIYSLELIETLKDKISSTHLDDLRTRIKGLVKDSSEAWVYQNDGFVGFVVGDKATDILKLFNN